MHVQAPTLSIPHRAQFLSALAAIAVAGGAYGAITIATNDDESTKSSQAPVATKADTRVLDGSPVLRGTANSVDTSRVLDGSAILRGTANSVDPNRVLDGSPLMRGVAQSVAPKQVAPTSALQPPRKPEGFHSR